MKYEDDSVRLPVILSWMSAKQLRLLANIISKLPVRKAKNRTLNSNIKFYI